jgi:hypothetical protein
MSGIKSPIEDAYWHAVSNRLFSMVYSALNGGVPLEDRKLFRKDWNERGTYHLNLLLLQCARPDWSSHPETFWIDPWIAEHLLAREEGSLCYIIDQWLDNQPLPYLVSEDPLVEDEKVRDLKKLFLALNR